MSRRLSPFRSRLFWRLALSYAAVVLVATAGIGWLLNRDVQQRERVLLERMLENTCSALEPFARTALTANPEPAVHERLDELAQATGQRITWILPEGKVVADTASDSLHMEDHGDRVEVRAALEGGTGVAIRVSGTLRAPYLYVARPVRSADRTLGVVRAALPLGELEQRAAAARATVIAGAAWGAGAALLVGLFVAHRITGPILEIARAASELAAGSDDVRVRRDSGDELGTLARDLERLTHRSEQRLARTSEEVVRLRAMLTAMVEGVIATDGDGRVAFCNDAALRLLDLSGHGVEGEPLLERFRIAGLGELLREALEHGGFARREVSVTRARGERILDAHSTPIEVGGDAKGLVVVLHDITELRRLERVRRDFVANVSHELKTPLTSIRGYVETLLDGALQDEQNNERFLRKIDRHVDRLSHLVSDLLSLARIESQQGELDLEPVDLVPLLREAAAHVEPEVRARTVALEDDSEGQPILVRGEREALHQVIGNLVENAVKYTPESGHVTLRCGVAAGHGWFEVEDDGIGIPAADLERIFERFYRVDRARSDDAGGTGLGLSIVKHLVSALEGEVVVSSRVGVGTCFRVELPLAVT